MILRFTMAACIALSGFSVLSCHLDADSDDTGHQAVPGTRVSVCGDEPRSRLRDAAIWSLATGLVLTAALIVTFSEIKPEDVPYLPRAGCEWYEGRRNGCDRLTAIPHQPFNTYSTVTFAVAGTFCAFSFAGNSSIGLVFMLSMIVLCIGSALFHGVPTRWSGHLDVIATYFVYSALAVLALVKALSSVSILAGLQPYVAELMLLVGMLGSVVLRMLFHQSPKLVVVKLAVLLGLTYPCAIYLLLRPAPMAWHRGWTALLGSLVLFGCAFLLHRIDLRKSERAGKRERSAGAGSVRNGGDGTGRQAGPGGGGTALIGKTLHAFWHILAAGGTSALFYALLYPDMLHPGIVTGTCQP